ncbi:MAG: DNA polymerase III subunit chi [Chromatiales bacterium]|jgi:DNA polymerase-3 subunit chi|nr:DNA polymerase III subunit chi [Chromatiales bacterium]
MTRVDFYVLESSGPTSRLRCACRIAEKAFLLDHRIYIHAGSDREARAMDDLLWSFRGGSFIPHAVVTPHEVHGEAVLIGHDADNDPAETDLLINLADEIPMFFSRFERVAEVVSEDKQSRESGRNRFRFYRDRGYDLRTHQLR